MDTSVEIKGAHVVLHKLLKVSDNCSVQAVLLYKRTHDAPVYPVYWALIGGQLDPQEQPEEAALREVKEELGIKLAGQDLIELYDVKIARVDNTYLIKYYSCPLDVCMDKLTLQWNDEHNKVEGEALGWFNAEEIHHLTVRPEDRVAINIFFENGT